MRRNGLGLMILCCHFAPNVRSNNKRARYHFRDNRALICENLGGRYWDRTSDLSGVNGRVDTPLTSGFATGQQGRYAVEIR
jgi:hypothetical protein